MSLLTNLVAYWKLEEASGTRDDSHGSNDLADNNTVTQAAGKVGNAGQFVRANTEYLSIADNAEVSAGNIDWTLSAWVYLDSKPASVMIAVGKDSNVAGNREYVLDWFNTNDRFRFVVFNAAGATKIAEANNFGAPTTATWYHLIGWNDATADTVNLAVNDGTADSTSTAAFTPNNAAAEFRIGARVFVGAVNPWDGRLDEVGLWKRVLTAAERTQLYNAGAGLAYPFTIPQASPARAAASVGHGQMGLSSGLKTFADLVNE